MTPEGEASDTRQLHDDIKRTLNAFLPKAITDVCDEILRDYKQKLSSRSENFPSLPNSNPTYAQSAMKLSDSSNEIQRFNEENRWFMNNMYRKRENALFKVSYKLCIAASPSRSLAVATKLEGNYFQKLSVIHHSLHILL